MVEMLGLPGAGKSTLTLALRRALAGRGVSVALPMQEATQGGLASRRIRSAALIAGLVARRPGYVMRSLRLIAATRQVPARAFLKVAHNWLHVSARFAGAGRGGTWLFDQGMYQALWSVAYGATAPRLGGVLAELAAIMPRPDVVVRLRVEPDVAGERLAARPGRQSRLETPDAAPGGPGPRFRRAQHALERVSELCRHVDPGTAAPADARPLVLDVDNNGAQGTAALADRLALRLLEWNASSAAGDVHPPGGAFPARPAATLSDRNRTPSP